MTQLISFPLPSTGIYKMAITSNHIIFANTSNNTVYIYTYPQSNILSPYIVNDYQFNTNNNSIIVPGTTAGTITIINTSDSIRYKKYMLYFSNYENSSTTAQTVTMPFIAGSALTINTTGMTVTFSNNVLTLPVSMSAPASGIIVLEGY
ncbi:MAG: hypothetical protein QXI16_00105 [Sulfolobaceae archaeon]